MTQPTIQPMIQPAIQPAIQPVTPPAIQPAVVNLRRRTFLAVALCIPALAASALLSRTPRVGLALPAAPDAAPDGAGYHETEHIRKYYRSAAAL